MEYRNQIARALGVGAMEMSVLCAGIMAFAFMNPQRDAVVVVFAALVCAALCFAYGRYVKRIGRESYLTLTAMFMWLLASLAWLPIAVAR